MPRYALLEHTGAPDDPKGSHLDLLLEDGESCRTWRLDQLPVLNGPSVSATPLPPHRLVWLERQSAAVSGGRGWARRIAGGRYIGPLPAHTEDPVMLGLTGLADLGLPEPVQLCIDTGHCRLCRLP